MDFFIGEIRLVGFNFPPVGWALCNGQLVSISDNSALFALLGTTYGGDGVNTFALPNLNSRVAVGANGGSTGPGLSTYQLGQIGGAETVTLTSAQLPVHNHPLAGTIMGATAGTASNDPAGRVPGPAQQNRYAPTAPAAATLAPGAVTVTAAANSGGQAHSNLPPVLALNYIIALEGIFPSQQ
jgi:microcystin-dependent protein